MVYGKAAASADCFPTTKKGKFSCMLQVEQKAGGLLLEYTGMHAEEQHHADSGICRHDCNRKRLHAELASSMD